MSTRLYQILSHIQCEPEDTPEMHDLKQRVCLQSLRALYNISTERLREMMYYMIYEMHEGLKKEGGSTLKMLPSFVLKKKVSNISGVYYALDLGGTNFRVIRAAVKQGVVLDREQKEFKIPAKQMHGDADDLFGFIANCVKLFQQEYKETTDKIKPLGFTFSFPVKQLSLRSGELITWTKGFTTKRVVGEDVSRLLQNALDKVGAKMKVVALCNDTVTTLVTRYFTDQTTQVGVILGTGSNACYFEKSRKILKDPKLSADLNKGEEMIINIEFGGFDSKCLHVLPLTQFDNLVDESSPNKGQQRFEKMISGMYAGEQVRQIICCLAANGTLPPSLGEALKVPYSLPPQHTSTIILDQLPGLPAVRELFQRHYNVDISNSADRRVVRELCQLVRHRAAQLSGMAVAAILLKSQHPYSATVAVDGTVFEKTPGFKTVMERTISKLLTNDHSMNEIRLMLTKEGSGIGAALIAALTEAKE